MVRSKYLVEFTNFKHFLVAIIDRIGDLEVIFTHKFSPIKCKIIQFRV
jgi:hypothetical protein